MSVLHTFDIPEDDGLLASWLEAKIAGLHLGELVAELEVLREADETAAATKRTDGRVHAPQARLEDVLENRLPDVCERGLAAVPAKAIRRFFREPELLIELQDCVLIEGGDYWNRKLQESDELVERTEVGWTRLSEKLADKPTVLPLRETVSMRPARPIRWFVAGFAAAAAVALVGIMIREPIQRPAQVAQAGWGWSRPDAFPSDVSREHYLRTLADEAEEWRRRRPDTAQALAQRINEFRDGCSRLILAEHKPLPAADRNWLVERCRVWANKLDEELAEVEARKDPLTVRSEVDETVNKLVAALRTRAQQPAPT